MNTTPLLSVAVITYGHEEYIEQALNSILIQKVNFNYEIIVGEDCSQDGTRKILKEFERNYPDKFQMIYRDVNIGAHRNVQDVYKRCKGKYIAVLEGDDYWISNQKLQRQIDYLEANNNCIATSHRVFVVDEHGIEKKNKHYPECKNQKYTFKHYKRGLLPGQSASIVCRNIYSNNLYDVSIFDDSSLIPGDQVKAFVLASYGGIYCFPDKMSAYRHVTKSGSSYSATVNNKKYHDKISYYYKIMTYAKRKMNNSEAIKTAESLYFWNVMRKIRSRDVNWKYIAKSISELDYKISAILFMFNQLATWPVRIFKFKQPYNI